MKRLVIGQRLAYFHAVADSSYWDEHWKNGISKKMYEQAESGELGMFSYPFLTFLPKHGRILEAGCGRGQYVVALRSHGYNCEGVEWGKKTVFAVKKLYPKLPIQHGDVTNLGVPDKYYQGYISLGVVEHRQDGPEPFLSEAARVLANDGVMLLSVPFFHSLRQWKARLGFYRGSPAGLDFYQYAFTVKEMRQIILDHGFQVIDEYPYGGFKSLKDEIPFLQTLVSWPWIGWRAHNFFNKWEWARQHWGHMVMFVCNKNG